jgi:hypothetical protein
MASKRFEKNSEEWQMFTEFWSLCQKYWIPDKDDEYWKSVTEESIAFGEKYKTEFAKKLVFALLDSLEDKRKRELE